MTSEALKALGRRVVQAWNEGRPEVFDEAYASAYRNHFNGETLDELLQGLRSVRSAFSDFTITIEDELVDGDKLVARWTARGIHSGEYLGIPATGVQVEYTGIHIVRVDNGRIIDEWSRVDEIGLLRQLGMAV